MFGGLRADDGERVVARFQTRKSGALLAYLALGVERSHSRDELAELLWPDSDPEAGRTSLRTALASLRRQLEPPGAAGAVILADRSTVGIRPGAITTDIGQFRCLLRSADNTGTGSLRLEHLLPAIDLYAGPLLPEFDEPWMEAERRNLAEAYLGAIRRVIRTLARERDYERAIDYARRATEADPLSEEAHRDLIGLYALAGRAAVALNVFAEFERRILIELDETPSATTRRLAERIAADDGRRLGSSRSVRKPAAVAIRGGIKSAPTLAPSLPSPLTRFFGRDADLERLRALMRTNCAGDTARLVTLTGTGGCGKTRLAVEAARLLQDDFGGRVWFAALADLTDYLRIPGALVAAMGLKPAHGADTIGQVLDELAGKSGVLILDNMEHLSAGGSSVVQRLLAGAPGLKCLVTSRRRLGIPGERTIAVQPLDVPLGTQSPEEITCCASVQLFTDRAQAAKSDFQVTRGNAQALAQLCIALEGIPLALELAAARTQGLTPAQMVERLADCMDGLLTARRSDREPRHMSLRAAIAWSYDLLTPEQQRLFTRLSVFHGGFTPDAVEEVCGQEAALEYLSQLRDRSMIVSDEASGEPRFRILESLREFASSNLGAGDREDYGRRHAHHFLAVAESNEPVLRGPNAPEALDRLEREHPNMRAALNWGKEHDGDVGLRLAGALWNFWRIRGHAEEGREWIEALISRYPDSSLRTRARALTTGGILATATGDVRAARKFFEQALDARRAVGEPQPVATALGNLGAMAYDIGDYDGARAHYEESLELYRSAGDEYGVALLLNNLANVARALDDLPQARALLEESLGIQESIGNRRGVATVQNNLGEVALTEGELEEALRREEESLAIYRQLDDKNGTAYAYETIGCIALARGDIAAAREPLAESLRIRLDLHNRCAIASSLERIAEMRVAELRAVEAATLIAASAAIRDASGCPPTPQRRRHAESKVKLIRAALSPKAFGTAWERGRTARLDEIADEALSDYESHGASGGQVGNLRPNRT